MLNDKTQVNLSILGHYKFKENHMLTILNNLPDKFLTVDATQLHNILNGPTLIHLKGRREQPLFISTLLHGNEITGFQAIQELLKRYIDKELPRSLSIFIGNVDAAKIGARRLENQPDYNRTWPGTEYVSSDETIMMQTIKEEMRQRNVFASIDIHNNTGLNPHYACVNKLDDSFFHLARLFSRTIVYFTRPIGVQSQAFADLCPSTTIECGQVGQATTVDHALTFIDAALHLSEMPHHPIQKQDIDLFHTIAIVKIPEQASLSFNGKDCQICLDKDIDHMNFKELKAGTRIGEINDEKGFHLEAWNNDSINIGEELFDYRQHEIRLKKEVMPAMLTLNEKVIRQDCLCYLMERFEIKDGN